MATIDWDEYKEFKRFTHKEDKLQIAVDFVKSYYNMNNPYDVYDMLTQDDIGNMLLQRKDITDAEALENFMFQS